MRVTVATGDRPSVSTGMIMLAAFVAEYVAGNQPSLYDSCSCIIMAIQKLGMDAKMSEMIVTM